MNKFLIAVLIALSTLFGCTMDVPDGVVLVDDAGVQWVYADRYCEAYAERCANSDSFSCRDRICDLEAADACFAAAHETNLCVDAFQCMGVCRDYDLSELNR